MTGTADPYEPPPLPAFQYRVQRTPNVICGGGPERIYDAAAADSDYEPPRIRSFTHVWTDRATGDVIAVAELGELQVPGDREPQLWQDEGDQA